MAQVNLGRVVGYSAYEIAVQEGFVGTEAEWLASLQGADGQPGQTGATGADGTTFTPSVSSEGVISWTNDGGKTNPSPVNIKGPQGVQGPQGPTGPAGTYTEGTGIDIDNGVLSVDTTVVALKSDLGDELPPIASGDAGKVLKVNAGETAVEWANDASQTYTGGTGIDITNNEISVDNTVAMKSDIPADELPTISAGDAGKVLKVNSGETGVEWATDSTGSYTAGTGIDITGGEISVDNTVALKSDIPSTTKIIEIDLKNNRTEVDMSSLSADDTAYIVNAMINGFEDYPFVVKANYWNGSNQYAVFTVADVGLRFGISNNYYYFYLECNEFYYGSGSKRLFIRSNETSPYTVQGMAINDSNVASQLANKQDTLTAGTNITISGNTISATVPQELPSISAGDAGKVLKVNSGETGVEWASDADTNPIYRVSATNFSAAAYSAAVSAHNNGKLVLLDDTQEGKYNAPLLGIFQSMFDTAQFNENYTESLSSLDFSDLNTALGDSWDFVIARVGLDNGEPIEFGFSGNEYSSGVLSRDWLEIDTVNDTVNTNGEGTLTYLEIGVFLTEQKHFMAFNMIDCYNFYDNGNAVPTFDAINYQCIEDGRVFKNNVYLQGGGNGGGGGSGDSPTLNRLWLGYTDNGTDIDMIDLDGVSIETSLIDNNFIHWNVENITLPEALSTSHDYGFAFGAGDGDFQSMGDMTFTWVDDNDFHAYVGQTGPLEIDILPQGTQTDVIVHIVFNTQFSPQPSGVPSLVSASMTDENSNTVFSIGNASIEGFVDGDDCYHYMLFTNDDPLTYANGFQANEVLHWTVMASQGFSGNGGGSVYALSGNPDWDYMVEGGPDKFWIKSLGNNQYRVDYQRNPSWYPPVSEITSINIDDNSSGNTLYTSSGLNIEDVAGVYNITGAQFVSALTDNQVIDVSISMNNGPSISGETATLSAISGTPNLTCNASMFELVFYPQSGTTYNIAISISGEN